MHITEDDLSNFCRDNGITRTNSLRVTYHRYPTESQKRHSCKGYKIIDIIPSHNSAIAINKLATMACNHIEDVVGRKSVEYNKDTMTVEDIIHSDVPITSDIILEKFNLSKSEWEVEKYKTSQWEQSKKGQNNKTQLYSVKATFKKVKVEGNINLLLDKVEEITNNIKPLAFKGHEYNERLKYSETLLLDIADLHLNKYIGDEYNTEVAISKLYDVVDYMITNTEASNCIFIVGEDMFNIDTLTKTTTRGTPQDTNESYYEMYEKGLKGLINVVSKLSTVFNNLKVVLVQGNHDELTSFTVTKTLEAYFREYDNIEFDSTPRKRKYIKIGNSLIGLGHMDNESKSNKPFLLQNEVKEWFGESKFCYFISGHFHNYSVEDLGGIQFIRLPTLSPPDEWHYRKGYVLSQKGAIGLVFNESYGLTHKILYND